MIDFKKRRGIVLIISLLITVLIFMGSLVYLWITATEKGLARKDYWQKQAFWLAEAGIERARNEPEIATTLNASLAINAETVTVVSTADFPSPGSASVYSASDPNGDIISFNYTGKTPTTFTGVTGVTIAFSSGDYVTYIGPFTVPGIGQYIVIRTQETEGPHIKLTFNSHGYVPSRTSPKAQKEIIVVIKKYNLAGFAISSQGNLNITGNTAISGDLLSSGNIDVTGSAIVDGEKIDNTSFSATFDNIFGKTRAELLDRPPDYSKTDASSADVDKKSGLTWITFSENTEFKIEGATWSASGILVVDGGNLKMTGGTFDGIIWVTGTLSIAGGATINGTIFVESGATVQSTEVYGNPGITYDKAQIVAALTDIGASFPTETITKTISWRDF